MSTYLITGKLGTGKTKSAVRIIQVALSKGLRVATNLDINLDKLMGPMNKRTLVRIPDKPTVDDLECIGVGNESYDEEKNGVIILDELGSWLNARTFADKSRQPVIDWLIHSRKKGWHVYFICQNIAQIDKQVREALVEFVVRCSRLDRIKMPGIGWFLNCFNDRWGYLPRMHIATVRMGASHDGMIADRWYYQGDDLHAAYDTRQIFRDNYPNGAHSMLSSWHVFGRHLDYQPRTGLARIIAHIFKLKPPAPAPKRQVKPMLPMVYLVSKLPPGERVYHLKRLDQLGALGKTFDVGMRLLEGPTANR
jgi:hypothetical protein